MKKASYLLSHAQDLFTISKAEWFFDEKLQLNLFKVQNNSPVPVCTVFSMITNSKTDAAPGDDDPDPEMEVCY